MNPVPSALVVAQASSGMWDAISLLLVLVLVVVVILTAVSVVSALMDMILYSGCVAAVIAVLFYFVDSLSFAAAWDQITNLVALSLLFV